jgi:hypothetical protein
MRQVIRANVERDVLIRVWKARAAGVATPDDFKVDPRGVLDLRVSRGFAPRFSIKSDWSGEIGVRSAT